MEPVLPPQPEVSAPIDRRSFLVADMIRTQVVAAALLAVKPELKGILPEPFNVGDHVGNFGMTMGITGAAWLAARDYKLKNKPTNDPNDYRTFRKRMVAGTVAGAVALNMAVEYAPLRLRELYSSRLTTSDPLDVAYGILGGLAATVFMSSRFRRQKSSEVVNEPGPEVQPARRVQQSPVSHRPAANHSGNKTKRKMQQSSRRKNRQH